MRRLFLSGADGVPTFWYPNNDLISLFQGHKLLDIADQHNRNIYER